MGRILLDHLQDVSLRSLLLATLAAAVLWPAWGRRSAAAMHAVWSTVLAGMLVLLAAGPLLPAIRLRILADTSAQAAAPAPEWREVAFLLYAAVALVLLMRVAAGLARRLKLWKRLTGASSGMRSRWRSPRICGAGSRRFSTRGDALRAVSAKRDGPRSSRAASR